MNAVSPRIGQHSGFAWAASSWYVHRAPVCYPGPIEEIVWDPVNLSSDGEASCLAALRSGGPVLHWHCDTFDLPDNALRLASTPNYENQAFTYGKAALAFQFHLEADPSWLEEWYVGHAVELAAEKVSVLALRRATAKLTQGLRQQAETVFGRWLAEIDGYVHAELETRSAGTSSRS